jgi:hypothetical protein
MNIGAETVPFDFWQVKLDGTMIYATPKSMTQRRQLPEGKRLTLPTWECAATSQERWCKRLQEPSKPRTSISFSRIAGPLTENWQRLARDLHQE